jgi:uncharacterized membrane protein YfcA
VGRPATPGSVETLFYVLTHRPVEPEMSYAELLALAALAFVMEGVDNCMGGGFGTIMSPLLILLGYDPKVVVPAILFSEAVSGLWGGAWHARFGNVDPRAAGATLLGSLAGMAAAALLMGEVLPAPAVRTFIAGLAVAMGAFAVMRSFGLVDGRARSSRRIGAARAALLGLVVGFNKGGSGGGYGPLSVSGYMLLGMPAAVAIGTTTVAEGISCALGVALYSRTAGISLPVAVPLAVGSLLADPVSAWANNELGLRLRPPFHGRLIGLGMVALGVLTLLRAYFS